MVHTKIQVSPIHGMGCFASEPVRSGSIVWRLDPRIDLIFTAAEIVAMPEALQIFLVQYASKDAGQDRYVYCSDNARFINHAAQPNLVHNANTSATFIFARHDIQAGSELTLDYEFVDDPDEPDNLLTKLGVAFGEPDFLDPRLKNLSFR